MIGGLEWCLLFLTACNSLLKWYYNRVLSSLALMLCRKFHTLERMEREGSNGSQSPDRSGLKNAISRQLRMEKKEQYYLLKICSKLLQQGDALRVPTSIQLH